MKKITLNGFGLLLALASFLIEPMAHAQVLKLRADRPDAKQLGQELGYKACGQALIKPECRVGAWSAPAPALSNSTVKPSSNPWPLPDREQAPKIVGKWACFLKISMILWTLRKPLGC